MIFSFKKNVSVKIPDYPGVKEKIVEKGMDEVTLESIRQIIKEIRSVKLPDPNNIPNVGSFFKNPIVSTEVFEKIKERFPNIKSFPAANGIKIPAGWLIENAGLKGKDFGKISTYKNNALVLVNDGGATFSDVLKTEEEIRLAVKGLFGIELEREPIKVS